MTKTDKTHTNITIIPYKRSHESYSYRNKTNLHTFLQILVGSIVGLIMGYLFYYLASKHIRWH